MDTFASRLKYARNLRHLSQEALARKCGLSQSAISSYESGARKDPSKILSLADALDVSVYWLGEGLGPMLPSHATGLPLGENTWPFASINPSLFWSLTAHEREAAERALSAFIDSLLKTKTAPRGR
ncbi:hypothetical protein CDEF62S_03530 [Castellaniella defragrans]